jgi:hypothetical protein
MASAFRRTLARPSASRSRLFPDRTQPPVVKSSVSSYDGRRGLGPRAVGAKAPSRTVIVPRLCAKIPMPRR